MITGAAGRIGTELAPKLLEFYGEENVLLTDIVPSMEGISKKNYKKLDVTDRKAYEALVKSFKPDTVIQLAAVLSARSEEKPDLSHKVNRDGGRNAIELATELQYKIFLPSSIGSFGPASPKKDAPDLAFQRPINLYGISKVFLELYGEYNYFKFGTDFRSLRLPTVIANQGPRNSLVYSDVDIYYKAVKEKRYTHFLRPDYLLPVIYIDDFIINTIKFLEAPNEKLSLRTYNVQSCAFTIQEQVSAIKKLIPDFEVSYEVDSKQSIMDSLPETLSDTAARKDWGFESHFDIDSITKDMIEKIQEKLKSQESS